MSQDARDHDTLLREFLRSTDEACPSCGYPLRGLTGPACPECGSRLRLGVREEPHEPAWFTTGVIALAAALGLQLVLFLVTANEPGATARILPRTIVALTALSGWLLGRRRVGRARAGVRAALVAGSVLSPFVLFALTGILFGM